MMSFYIQPNYVYEDHLSTLHPNAKEPETIKVYRASDIAIWLEEFRVKPLLMPLKVKDVWANIMLDRILRGLKEME